MKDRSNDQLVLIGDYHESIPVLLIADPDLSSNDKILWQVLRISIQRNQGHISMPAQNDMATIMGVTKKTVIASMNTLRVTRWLSVQHQFDEAGRQTRNIYAIHTRPASISDAVALDDQYPVLLNKCAREGPGRTGHLAGQALRDMNAHTPLFPSRLLADQDEYDAALEAYGNGVPVSSGHQPNLSFFGRTPVRFGPTAASTGSGKKDRGESVDSPTLGKNCPESRVTTRDFEIGLTEATLDSGGKTAKNGENIRGVKITPLANTGGVKITPHRNGANIRGVKNTPLANTGGVKITPRSSSNYYKNTTTTDTEIDIDTNEKILKLSGKEKQSLLIYLEKIPTAERQAFWDEFTGTVVRKADTPFPVHSKVIYFRAMVKKFQQGQFRYTEASDRIAGGRATDAAVKAAHRASRDRMQCTAKEALPGEESVLSPRIARLKEQYSKRSKRKQEARDE